MNAGDFARGFYVVGQLDRLRNRRPCNWMPTFKLSCEGGGYKCESYLSAFAFTREIDDYHREHAESVKGFRGRVSAFYIPIDVDREGDLPAALRDTRLLLMRLIEARGVDPEQVLVFFSGYKGFHVLLLTALCGAQPGDDFDNGGASFDIAEQFCRNIAGEIEIDAIYDKVRCFRLPNSRHPKSGRFKVRLTVDETMSMSIDGILKLAEQPRPFELPDAPGAVNPRVAAEWTQAEIQTRARAKAVARRGKCAAQLNRATIDFIRGKVTQGNRHRLLFSAAANLRELGAPLHLAEELLSPAALALGLDNTDEIIRHIHNGYGHAAQDGVTVTVGRRR